MEFHIVKCVKERTNVHTAGGRVASFGRGAHSTNNRPAGCLSLLLHTPSHSPSHITASTAVVAASQTHGYTGHTHHTHIPHTPPRLQPAKRRRASISVDMRPPHETVRAQASSDNNNSNNTEVSCGKSSLLPLATNSPYICQVFCSACCPQVCSLKLRMRKS